MRETLHQLALTLALPIAVGAVWGVRGEPIGNPLLVTATAYRAELAELPLPTRERLRTPGIATDLRVARLTPEDSTLRRRRPLLPNLPAPRPIDLGVEADSSSAVAAPVSRRAAQELQGAAPPAPPFPLRAAPALVAVAPSTASPRTASVAASDGAEQPAALPDRARSAENFSPIATSPGRILPSPREKFEFKGGRNPLTPSAPLAGSPDILRLRPDSAAPSLPAFDDLSLAPLEPAAEPSVVDPKPAPFESPPKFVWGPTLSPTLLMIPEPGSALLLGAALAALGAGRCSRRRA